MHAVSKQNAPLLVRGSVVLVSRRCGKVQCRCAQGELHQTWALSYSQKGRSRMIPLREEDLPATRQAVQRYRTALEALESQGLQGIKTLHAAIKAAKGKKR